MGEIQDAAHRPLRFSNRARREEELQNKIACPRTHMHIVYFSILLPTLLGRSAPVHRLLQCIQFTLRDVLNCSSLLLFTLFLPFAYKFEQPYFQFLKHLNHGWSQHCIPCALQVDEGFEVPFCLGQAHFPKQGHL